MKHPPPASLTISYPPLGQNLKYMPAPLAPPNSFRTVLNNSCDRATSAVSSSDLRTIGATQKRPPSVARRHRHRQSRGHKYFTRAPGTPPMMSRCPPFRRGWPCRKCFPASSRLLIKTDSFPLAALMPHVTLYLLCANWKNVGIGYG